MTNIIAVINHKGGVGKTTSALNIGHGLAKFHNQKVLLIDLDSQANLTRAVGIQGAETSIYHALTGKTELPIHSVNDNVDIIPSGLELSFADLELSGEMGREFILKNLLKDKTEQYDFVIIDCPPSLGLLTINALTTAKDIFIPLEPEFLSMYGLENMTVMIDQVKTKLSPSLSIRGVFLTKFESRIILHQKAHEAALAHFPDTLLKTSIRKNIALAEAPSAGEDIYTYSPQSNGAEDYKAITKEVFALYQ